MEKKGHEKEEKRGVETRPVVKNSRKFREKRREGERGRERERKGGERLSRDVRTLARKGGTREKRRNGSSHLVRG